MLENCQTLGKKVFPISAFTSYKEKEKKTMKKQVESHSHWLYLPPY
jgi:hypothetical protein